MVVAVVEVAVVVVAAVVVVLVRIYVDGDSSACGGHELPSLWNTPSFLEKCSILWCRPAHTSQLLSQTFAAVIT
jgi:hypothetical protein